MFSRILLLCYALKSFYTTQLVRNFPTGPELLCVRPQVSLCLAKALPIPSTANQPQKHRAGWLPGASIAGKLMKSWLLDGASVVTGNWCNFKQLERCHISCWLNCLTQTQKIRGMKKQPSLPPDSAMLCSKSHQLTSCFKMKPCILQKPVSLLSAAHKEKCGVWIRCDSWDY